MQRAELNGIEQFSPLKSGIVIKWRECVMSFSCSEFRETIRFRQSQKQRPVPRLRNFSYFASFFPGDLFGTFLTRVSQEEA